MNDIQNKSFKFFQEHLAEYLKDEKLKNKFAVLSGEKLDGYYDTFELAIQFATSKFPVGDFIIQQIVDDKDVVNFVFSARDIIHA